MIVSHQHEFIFLKTRKTAGTSIEIALSEICGPDDIITQIHEDDEVIRNSLGFLGPQNDRQGSLRYFNHMPGSSIRECLGVDQWHSYFKFTIERDPFDKVLSRYWWSTRHSHRRPTVSDYVASVPPALLSCWSIYATSGVLDVDYVIRYEELELGLREVSDRIGSAFWLPSARAKGAHRLDRTHYSKVLDGNSRRRIEHVCAREISEFGYVWTEAIG